MTLCMCNWLFPPPFVGQEFRHFLVEKIVSFSFLPCQSHCVPSFSHVLKLLTPFIFAWATSSHSLGHSDTPYPVFALLYNFQPVPVFSSCSHWHVFIACSFCSYCLELLCSIFCSTETIIRKLPNFLFSWTIINNVNACSHWPLSCFKNDYLSLPCLC